MVFNSKGATTIDVARGYLAGITAILEHEAEEVTSPEHLSAQDSLEAGSEYWLVLSMLETFEGKEAREIYYAGLYGKNPSSLA